MTIFLMSILGTSIKVDGVRVPKRVIDENGLETQLKESVKKFDNLVFVASDAYGYEKTDEYARVNAEGLAMSGMKFKNVSVLDNRTRTQAKELVERADLLFLNGGPVPTQNNFLQEINLKGLLKNFKGVLAGQSAGAMNMAELVINYPESLEELDDAQFLQGLGVTDINIIPHFNPVTGNEQVDDGIDLMKILKGYSKKYPLVCLMNGSHIKIEDDKAEIFGEAYLIKNEKLIKLCENCKSIEWNQKTLNK